MARMTVPLVTLVLLLSFAAPTTAGEKCLIMGLLPAEDPKEMMAQYTPMKNWMAKEMGRCIKVFTATDYTGVIEAMRAKKVDFAWYGPFSYVLANRRAGAEAFAVGVDKDGSATYHSYLVARPEVAQKLGIETPLQGEAGMKVLLAKLQRYKKTFTLAFTDPASTSGFAVPRYFMMRAGLVPKKAFKAVGYVGSHYAAEFAVKNGIIDIVADNDKTHTKLMEAGRISTETNVIIWRSPPIPGPPVALRKDLPEDVKAALKRAISSVPRDTVTGHGKITAYKIVDDTDYKIVKDIKEAVDQLN
jgi:phosphonate transport system substrate-binding protein